MFIGTEQWGHLAAESLSTYRRVTAQLSCFLCKRCLKKLHEKIGLSNWNCKSLFGFYYFKVRSFDWPNQFFWNRCQFWDLERPILRILGHNCQHKNVNTDRSQKTCSNEIQINRPKHTAVTSSTHGNTTLLLTIILCSSASQKGLYTETSLSHWGWHKELCFFMFVCHLSHNNPRDTSALRAEAPRGYMDGGSGWQM